MSNNKEYWSSLDEKRDNLETKSEDSVSDLPVLNSIAETISTKKSGRRDFLKMLGFSVSAAAVAAACEMPVRKSIPYVIKPEEITPGVPNYYASTYTKGGNYNSVLVKTREGRPILLEGNKSSKISNGGVDAKSYASLLNLYDEKARIKQPLIDGKSTDWKTADSHVAKKLSEAVSKGQEIVLLSSTILSPSTKKVIAKFQSTYPNAEWVQYDAISESGLLDANNENFGKRAIPEYHFDNADLIVSVGADFLGTWISPTEFSADYAKGRKLSATNKKMSRHVQVESIPTLTGSNADLRIPVMPSQEALALLKLYNLVASATGNTTLSDSSKFENAKLKEVAKDLVAARGKSIVVSGSNSKEVQLLTNAINEMLGNYGKTITWDRASYYKQGDDTKLNSFLADLKGGKVGVVLVLDANPAYNLGEAFTANISKATLVDFSTRQTETTAVANVVCPDNHFLESWDDVMPKDGVYATIQPTIHPLFKTRQAQESLLKWSGDNTSYYDFIQANWKTDVLPAQRMYSSFDALWDNAVHDGEVTFTSNGSAVYTASNLSSAASAVVKNAKSSDVELKLYEKSQIGDGTVSDNPWMQELADPITRMTWDNYLMANPKWVEEKGLWHNTKNREYKVAKVTVGGKELTLPVVAMAGVPYGALGFAYGYGRTKTTHPEYERGENAFALLDRTKDANAEVFSVGDITAVGGHKMAIVQQEFGITHKGLGGVKTRKVVKETTLTEWQENPAAGNDINFGSEWMGRKEWMEKYSNSLYGGGVESNEIEGSKDYGGAHYEEQRNGHHWGMGIDLNLCIGCGACVVACNVENNVPIVGRNEVRRAHDMNWLRIDKYHTGDEENPQVIFQPMLCQHCDNAPCENVCPVAATNHSTEGLNQMTYNRCIGTRYCANNCPYKVRRFNWYDYQGADSFTSNEGGIWNNDFDGNDGAVSYNGTGLGLHSPLAKMVLNPDVTVRSRGVIEKCSFCVQRIQLGKLEAKKANRPLRDNDIVTACQAACGTDAITFGDTNNQKSIVSGVWADPRAFGVIEEIHTLPSVRYLTKVRNQKTEDLV
ncbi:MAG: 4Fe-4S dicluster domain-containing protein [Chitinophagales bacterium]|nr:4Fe-4S dicluster domain-containing protein [Chitinophagales bacterium]